MTAKPNVLTVERYKFYKTQETPLADAKIAEIFGLNINQLNAFKKENDLVGKFDVKKTRVNDVKTYKATDLKKEEGSSKESEVPLLKENDTASVRALKAIEEYEANKKVKQKLEARKDAPAEEVLKSNPDTFDALTYSLTSAVAGSDSVTSENGQLSDIKDQLKQKLADLEKEKGWLEEQRVKDTAEKDALRIQLEKAKQESNFIGLIFKVSEDVKTERFRQNGLYGRQRHEYGRWLAILAEEFGEVAQAMQKGWGWGKETDADDLYKELIHTAAVSQAIAEQVLEEQTK